MNYENEMKKCSICEVKEATIEFGRGHLCEDCVSAIKKHVDLDLECDGSNELPVEDFVA